MERTAETQWRIGEIEKKLCKLDVWYISSWIDVEININPGVCFYDKTKKTFTRT